MAKMFCGRCLQIHYLKRFRQIGMPSLLLEPAAAVLLLLIMTGCGLLSNNTTAVLWTDRPELAAYAELFNAENADMRVEVIFKETPWLALEIESEHPDLVVGTRLDSDLTIEHFGTLDQLTKAGLISPDSFYRKLYVRGLVEDKPVLLPVSFSLPIFAFRSEYSAMISNSYDIDPIELRKFSREYNGEGNKPDRIGFSPRWQPESIYALAILFGVNFREAAQRLPAWDEADLLQAIVFSKAWVDEVNGGVAVEEFFKTKYMYDPLYKLLDSGRILFTYMEIHEFLSVPAEVRENLDFRWLSNGEIIQVCDEVLFIGRTKQSRQKKTSFEFISWLLSAKTQDQLLELAQFERMRSFGFAGGFSSVISVNSNVLPRYFPFLIGHIPNEESLVFPSPLPESWHEIKTEVLFPWLYEEVSAKEPSEALSDRMKQWLLQQPELYR